MGDGDCQNDLGEMGNTDIVFCITSLLSNLENAIWACCYEKDILAVITFTYTEMQGSSPAASICSANISIVQAGWFLQGRKLGVLKSVVLKGCYQ